MSNASEPTCSQEGDGALIVMTTTAQQINETPVPIQLTETPPAPEAPAAETQEKPAEDHSEAQEAQEGQSCEKPAGACCGGH
ncbi:hypothetical protein IAR50_001372 [Cryptococcus sp. DSM 104548]